MIVRTMVTMTLTNASRKRTLCGTALIALVGLIHLLVVPEVLRVRNIPGALVHPERSRGIRFSGGDLPASLVGVDSGSRDGRRGVLHVHREPHDRAADARRGVARPSGRPLVDIRSYLQITLRLWGKKKSPT